MEKKKHAIERVFGQKAYLCVFYYVASEWYIKLLFATLYCVTLRYRPLICCVTLSPASLYRCTYDLLHRIVLCCAKLHYVIVCFPML